MFRAFLRWKRWNNEYENMRLIEQLDRTNQMITDLSQHVAKLEGINKNLLVENEELRQAAMGAKQNYAQAKFSKLSNAYDSMTSNNQIITDASQMPNQENFFVPAHG